MDRSFGQLVECLEENQVLDNTLIIFTSDNGGV
jgi:arylsulfatase A-like enzyme